MPVELLYDEEINQLAGTTEPAGLTPEVDVATLVSPAAAPKGELAYSAAIQDWERRRRQVQSTTKIEEWKWRLEHAQITLQQKQSVSDAHPGTREWNAYVASPACRTMMQALHTQCLTIAVDRLNKHWGIIFSSKMARITVRDFLAKLVVEVLFPSLENPKPGTQLYGTSIQLGSNGPVNVFRTVPSLAANDTRYEVGKPLVILSWGDDSPWCVIAPGKFYQQFGTFQYTDERQKVWGTGEVLSQAFQSALSMNTMRTAIEEAERAFADQLDYKTAEIDTLSWRLLVQELGYKIKTWSRVALAERQLSELSQRAEMFESGDKAAPRGLLLTGPPGTGKTLIAKSVPLPKEVHFVKASNFQQLSLADLKQAQVGASGQKVREIWNRARANQPAILFLDECEGVFGRRGAAETDSFSNDIVQTFLAEWDGVKQGDRIWVIGATNRRDMLDDAILSRFGWEMEIALPGPDQRMQILRHEMEEVYPGAAVPEDMASLTQGLSGRDLRTLASAIRTLAYPKAPQPKHFHNAVQSTRKSANTRVDADATWDTLIVDAPVMDKLKLSCALLRNAEAWKSQGIDIPQSMLLTGPAGTGKTQIARTLANESGLGFLAATTADVKAGFLGQSGNRVKQLFERARTKAPVILFLDELDIIAPRRGASHDPLTEEIVGQLLQELNGITAHDNQVFLLGATNLPEQIDTAVLSRFQQTIAIPLPDVDARQRLLTVLLGKKRLGFDLKSGAEVLALMTEGKQRSGRDLQSWVGRAEQQALMRAIAAGGPEHFSLLLEDFD